MSTPRSVHVVRMWFSLHFYVYFSKTHYNRIFPSLTFFRFHSKFSDFWSRLCIKSVKRQYLKSFRIFGYNIVLPLMLLMHHIWLGVYQICTQHIYLRLFDWTMCFFVGESPASSKSQETKLTEKNRLANNYYTNSNYYSLILILDHYLMLHHCYSFKTTYNTSKHAARFCFALPCFAFTRNVKNSNKSF